MKKNDILNAMKDLQNKAKDLEKEIKDWLNSKKKIVLIMGIKKSKVKSISFVNQNAIKLDEDKYKPSKILIDGVVSTIPEAWKAYKKNKFKTIEFYI